MKISIVTKQGNIDLYLTSSTQISFDNSSYQNALFWINGVGYYIYATLEYNKATKDWGYHSLTATRGKFSSIKATDAAMQKIRNIINELIQDYVTPSRLQQTDRDNLESDKERLYGIINECKAKIEESQLKISEIEKELADK